MANGVRELRIVARGELLCVSVRTDSSGTR
jgi:hypothetical protein